MSHKFYYEKVIEDNLILRYSYDKDTLPSIREYCKDKEHKRYKEIPYELLFDFTKEGLKELMNCNYLVDFRDLEKNT